MSAFFRSSAGVLLTVVVLVVLASLPISLGLERTSLVGASVLTLFALVSFLVLPLLLIRYVLKEDPRSYGWRFPENALDAIIHSVPILVILLGTIFLVSRAPQFQSFYSLQGTDVTSGIAFLVPAYLLYFLAEEFLFRGYLFHALRTKGLVFTLVANVALFSLFHIHKPGMEILIAGLTALLFCLLTERTKSVLPAILLHIVAATTLFFLINT